MFQFFSTTTDHYLYLSMFGPALALAWLLSVRPLFTLRLTTAAVLLALIAITIRQGGFWQNDFALFTHDTQVNPNSVTGYINLGGAYTRAHDAPHAVEAFRNATRANPEYAMAWDNLGAALLSEGKTEEAIAPTQRAVELQIKYPNLRLKWAEDNAVLGRMLFDTGRFGEAIPYLQTANELDPKDKTAAEDLKQARQRAATRPAGK
jgi:superkiller protein 3